jgi:pantoate--beta-alanine ligase
MTVVVRTREALRAALDRADRAVGLVPTMGWLHDGHRALIRRARADSRTVVVSIFVNPRQFGDPRDLDQYPRNEARDVAICEAEGVDLVFAPAISEIYPPGFDTVVSVGALGGVLEGAARPGHFDGVLTVVAKLLNLTRPDVAYFGQKDAQQLLLIARMVQDLNFPVEVDAVPTVRDPDGLALSSRNMYLTDDDRHAALSLSRALFAGVAEEAAGADAVRRAAHAVLDTEPSIALDYLALVDPATLAEVPDDAAGPALLAVAARVGTTRLIDNVPISLRDR